MSSGLWMAIGIVYLVLSFAVPIYAVATERTDIRHGRLDFLKWCVLYISANLACGLLDHFTDSDFLLLLAFTIALILVYPFARSLVRRCRDAGWNKNWAYLCAIPYLNGLLAILMLFWGPRRESEPS